MILKIVLRKKENL